MKKFFISLAVLAVSAATIVALNADNKLDNQFEANVDALAAVEGNGSIGVKGTCAKVVNDCLFQCNSCGALYYTPTGTKGPATSKSGTCANCGKPVNS